MTKLTLSSLLENIVERQQDQPSLSAEMAAEYRAGREDLLGTLFGPMNGTTREPGEPGAPTVMQESAALRGLSLNDLQAYAQNRAQETENRMDRGQERGDMER